MSRGLGILLDQRLAARPDEPDAEAPGHAAWYIRIVRSWGYSSVLSVVHAAAHDEQPPDPLAGTVDHLCPRDRPRDRARQPRHDEVRTRDPGPARQVTDRDRGQLRTRRDQSTAPPRALAVHLRVR